MAPDFPTNGNGHKLAVVVLGIYRTLTVSLIGWTLYTILQVSDRVTKLETAQTYGLQLTIETREEQMRRTDRITRTEEQVRRNEQDIKELQQLIRTRPR